MHVNRGWVTRALYQQYVAQKQQTTAQTTEQPWRRPVGSVAVEAVVSEGEKVRVVVTGAWYQYCLQLTCHAAVC